jgi:YbbR domain-containing protein
MDHKKLLTWITGNWPAKVTSLVVAIILFAFHRMGELQERFFYLPLQINANNNLAPSSPYPRNIRVILRGNANNIYYVADNDIEVYLDITRYNAPGIYKVPVEIDRKGSALEPETPEIIVDPVEITLELDARMSKQIALSPRFQGYIESGYEMVSRSLAPSFVIIDGPAKVIENITELSTELIDLRSRSSDFTVRVQIANPNQLLSIRGDGMAEFSGFIRELIMINQFEEIPIAVKGLPQNLEAVLNPSVASVRIQGIQTKQDILDERQLIMVDCSGIKEAGVYELPLTVSLPQELTADRIEPERITVIVSAKER